MSIDLKPALDAAIDFLKRWTAEPLIFASHTDPVTGEKGAFEAKQFRTPVDWAAVRSWIANRQKDGNWCKMYFSVNTALGNVEKKLARTDLGSMVALHADIDIEPGESQEEGIERVVGIFQKYDKPPSVIVKSGGGAQGFWFLREPVPINGDATVAEDLGLYNKSFVSELGADHCFSLDHIMRLPGTANIPDARKRAKGRVPRLATLYKFDAERRYDLSEFAKAAPETVTASKHAGFTVPESFTPVAATDERLSKLDAKWLNIGLTGDAAKFAGDRSRMALGFVTACKRAGIDDETIANILMDPNWRVGECIRDKGGETRRQLRRLLERAQKFVKEDLLKPAVLGKDTWVHSAELFRVRVSATLIHHNGDWLDYRDGAYFVLDEDDVDSLVFDFLKESKVSVVLVDKKTKAETYTLEPFNPNSNDVRELKNTLRFSGQKPRNSMSPPCWINEAEGPPPDECISMRNGILHVPTRTLYPATPDFFTYNALPFAFEPGVESPLWLETIGQWWPRVDGKPSNEELLLQEVFGYLITGWTDLQKMFFALGPKRSGKGTIARVLKLLVGARNMTTPTLASLAKEFGRMPLIGKLLAMIHEIGFGHTDDRLGVTNILKAIVGEDDQSINRKNKDFWEGKLECRFFLFGNKLPSFADDSGALGERIIVLRMMNSFAGKEDTLLGKKLAAEISGIFAWALEGYVRLQRTRRFTMTDAGRAAVAQLDRLASSIRSFIDEGYVLDPAAWGIAEPALYREFAEWAERNHVHGVGRKERFIADVIEAYPTIKSYRPRKDARGDEIKGSRPEVLSGIRKLKAGEERGQTQLTLKQEAA